MSQTLEQQLIKQNPHIWSDVLETLKECVSQKRLDQLSTIRKKALLEYPENLTHGKVASEAFPLDSKQIHAKLTLYAIDQFTLAMTGVADGRRPALKDKLILSWLNSWFLQRGQCPSMVQFDGIWKRLVSPAWASGQLQRLGFWSVPTKEFVERIAKHIGSRPCLEIGAGKGLLAAGLLKRCHDLTVVDDGSWEGGRSPVKSMRKKIVLLDAIRALKIYSPEVVIASWPPPGNSFEKDIFATESVQLYIVINSKHQFASGNWDSYRQQKSFDCSISEPLNQLLRPVEAEQTVMIFRRKN
ncbi:MAG: hypothetical protein NT027_11870 [Proteobacteria bacterium]|nr:hypothetical protein [Pseudomonadota bacterium]